MSTESISTRLSLGWQTTVPATGCPDQSQARRDPDLWKRGRPPPIPARLSLPLFAGGHLDGPRGAGRGHANCRYRRRDHAFFWLHAGGSQDLVLVQGVLLQERLGQTVQPPSVFLEQAHRLLVALVHDPAHLLIEHLRGLLA